VFTVALVTPQQSAHYITNSLNYPFPSEIMKSTHSDNIVVIADIKKSMHSCYVAKGRTVDSLSKVL